MQDITDYVKKALEHICGELMLPQIKASLEVNYDAARKAHDSIHESLYLAGKLVPKLPEGGFHKHSAYFLYQWEIFDVAHRSLLDALSTYYGTAFTLLRSILELLIKGAFFDCLAYKKFRENSSVLDSDGKGKRIKNFINELINYKPSISDELESISGSIYDKISDFILERDNLPSISTMLKQIIEWNMLEGIEQPYNIIYGKIYKKLSFNVHAFPDYTDVGRVLLSDEKLFEERKVMRKYLLEYFDLLHTTMDIAMVITINILKENLHNFDDVKTNLLYRSKNEHFMALGLKYTPARIQSLLQKCQ